MLRISCVFALVIAAATVAHADPDNRAAALELFGQSDKAYKSGEFEKAADLLRKAHALYPEEPLLLYNLARALEGLGDAKGAVEQYELYLQQAKNIPDRGAIERRVQTLKAQLARQAEEARRRQEEEARRQQEEQQRQQEDQRRQQEEQQRQAEEARRREEAARGQPLPPGPGSPAGPPDGPSGSIGFRDVAPWATMGVGAALVVTGGVFGMRASSTHDDAVKQPIQAEALRLQHVAEHDATVANVMFGIGSAVAIGGVIWEIFEWQRGGASDERSVRLEISPTSVAVGWTWR